MILDRTIKNLFWSSVAAVIVIVIVMVSQPKTTAPQNETTPQPPPAKITTLFFAGDIMLSRNVADRIYRANDFILPFKNVMEKISQADMSFANLESPFSQKEPYFVPGTLVFNADPQSVEGLAAAGFDVLSTANNHSYDQGRAGIEFTLEHLKSSGIAAVGTGLDCRNGIIVGRNGINFGFLAYSYAAFNDGGRKLDPWVCSWNDSVQLAEDIRLLKQKADFVIVSFHAGAEYQRNPDQADVAKARAAIDAGADLLIGHHPHWIQTIEQYNGQWIFYSLGNFVFDQMWSVETREGLTVTVTINNNDNRPEITKVELRPVIIENYCCPRWANEQESLAILKKINPHTKGSVIFDEGKILDDWIDATNNKNEPLGVGVNLTDAILVDNNN